MRDEKTRDAPVAYQGTPGAFSEEAALQLCGGEVALRPCRTLEDVFRALVSGAAAAAVIPVENSIAGDVPGCRALIAQHHLRTQSTLALPVIHALIAPVPVPLGDVRDVHSHPMALAQCRRFLALHPAMRGLAAFDTAGAVADLMRQPPGTSAAIASRRAADHWGAAVLQDGIQDDPDNVTEFWLVTPTHLTRM